MWSFTASVYSFYRFVLTFCELEDHVFVFFFLLCCINVYSVVTATPKPSSACTKTKTPVFFWKRTTQRVLHQIIMSQDGEDLYTS